MSLESRIIELEKRIEILERKFIPCRDEVNSVLVVKKVNLIPPLPDVSNPIASLINYCRDHLGFEAEFRYCETPDGLHHAQIYFFSILVSEASDRRKSKAKELSAIGSLKKLNQDKLFLEMIINHMKILK